ncbi:hypothetical protein L6R52_13140 [Myxococcota bacterium]|nr:hypothetical protein [Myxococcota bacterium]
MMDNETKVRSASLRLSTVATSTRQTPKTDFGTVMRDGLIRAGNVAVDGLKVAAPFVPGGAIVSAALAGANVASNIGAPSYGAGGGETGFATGAAGLTAGGTGPAGGSSAAVGSYGASGTLSIPGRRPGLGTDLSGGSAAVSGTGSAAAGTGDAFNNMMAATKSMAEFQASFNLQYLQLQEKIQIDTRQFNLVSNIMKTKHDAAKNALNNVR